jgi:hypothetical protein
MEEAAISASLELKHGSLYFIKAIVGVFKWNGTSLQAAPTKKSGEK